MTAKLIGPGRFSGPIRGVVLDAGGVLFDDTLWTRWLHQVLRRVGVTLGYAALETRWETRYIRDVCAGRCRFADALAAMLHDLGLAPAERDELIAAACAKHRELDDSIRLLPGVRCALARLRAAGAALVVLCNSEHSAGWLQERLATLGLADAWSGVVSSRDLGRAMPDPACYHVALRTMGLPSGLCAFVGHKAEELRGAQFAGFHTIGLRCADDAAAEVCLDRFDDLVGLVVTSGCGRAAG